MSKIPTAQEFIDENWRGKGLGLDVKGLMIEFAKLHAEAQQEAILEKVNMIGVTQHNNNAPDVYQDFVYVSNDNGPDYGYTVNKESIINAYPLTNIK